MMTTVKLINISPSHINYHFCVYVIPPEIYSLSKFPAFNKVLVTLVIELYIRSLELLILPNCNVILLDQHHMVFNRYIHKYRNKYRHNLLLLLTKGG